MKIRQITIKNVTSYNEQMIFRFDVGLNILIGPNGGGKSNFQKILAVILSKFFFQQYNFRFDDNGAGIDPVDFWTRRALQRNLDRYCGNDGDQVITIDFAPEVSDIDNIRLVGENLEKFNEQLEYWESPYSSYEPFKHIEAIRNSDCLSYRIVNFELEKIESSAASAFREYLRTFFIFMRLSKLIPDITLTAPVFFFFSERTANRNVAIQTSQITENSYYSGYNSVYQAALAESTNLFQWGMQHFVKLWWEALNETAHTKTVSAFETFSKKPDVVALDKYLKKLGYNWGIHTDYQNATYRIVLKKAGFDVTPEKFSSGEREIVHFLLAMFALNVRDGLILVDEPELHLHPRWQRVFLGLFRDFAKERNNQFVIATHSPVFVTEDTINDIVRIYGGLGGSRKISMGDVDLPEKKNLTRMINSQNNERLFFADKVVLVEGITDRLIISSLLDFIAAQISNNEAIEVIEVGGKHNFGQYRAILNALDTPCFTIADRDYLLQIGSPDIKRLFTHNDRGLIKSIAKDKKSKDSKTLIKILDSAIQAGNLDMLREFWMYLKNRHNHFKQVLTEEEVGQLKKELEEKKRDGIWILSKGEIEDYLPVGFTQLSRIIELIENNGWIAKLDDEECRKELIEIACSIVGANEGQRCMLVK